MTQNPFQPWKQNFNLPNQFFRKNDSESTFSKMKNGDGDISPASNPNLSMMSHPFELNSDSQSYQSPVTSTNAHPPSMDTEQQQQSISKATPNGTKFSIFSQLSNLNKISAFDNLLLNASMSIEDEDLNGDKRQGMRKLMEQAISDEAKQQIAFILEKISSLRPAEKLLLYLKMPGGHSEVDPLKQSQNPLGSRSEISHTINWVRSHLEHDEKVSIPKQEVYEDYVTFCGKINIKPLSTADFGKVMKQVFPDIRPRRLGTRGHSRYCYAAMRKATKLQPPHLPDLSSETTHSDADKEEVAWKVIKSWSESLLNSQFDTFDELAAHISQNNLNSLSSSTSKQMLQKKLMQREMKDRKRLNNQTLKKRRKKRRKSTSSSPEPQQMNEDLYHDRIRVKREKETDGSAIENNDEQSENSSDVPMNLTSSEQSRRIQHELALSTNQLGVNGQYDGHDISVKSKLKNKLNATFAENNASIRASTSTDVHLDDNNSQYITCKKVRQAQQLKMTANSNSIAVTNQFTNCDVTQSCPPNDLQIETQTEMAMPSKIPAKRRQKKELPASQKRTRYPDKSELPEPPSISPFNQVEPSDLVVKKDDLKDDFILPRERFISICNMDRNALDTYLNLNEDSSQDPELMQYFGDDRNRNKSSECVEEDLGPMSTSVPLLENYQLMAEGKNEKVNDKNCDKISQLRSMLEEKYNVATGGNYSNESVIKNLLLKNQTTCQVTTQGSCEQSASYVTPTNSHPMMSQRHVIHYQNQNQSQQQQNHQQNQSQSSRNYQLEAAMTPANDKSIPQSPNTRRKNFSFVPIPSQSTRVKNINLNPLFKGDNGTSPFVSPRATPLNTKKPLHPLLSIRCPNVAIDKSVPVLGANNTAFCRPHQFKMEPASAPPSPSMIQSYNFSPQAQQNQFQFQPLTNINSQNQGTNLNYPVETRSQSVPPHCTNTNPYNSYTNYSSACSSVAPTPVPSDYQEFSDTNILDIFNNEQVPPSSIKMEANDGDGITELLDNEILNQNSDTSETDLMSGGNVSNSDATMRLNFASISRSVPNTPLPYHTNYCNNGMNIYNTMGKSVPTTPNANPNVINPFRYSPELQRTRDFLINGFNNSINNNNNNVINNNTDKLIKNSDAVSNELDELSNLDSSLLNSL